MDSSADWDCFFSSRRRHTRVDCDWSSDVCSSDLRAVAGADHGAAVPRPRRLLLGEHAIEQPRPQDLERLDLVLELGLLILALYHDAGREEIGRASCRERV